MKFIAQSHTTLNVINRKKRKSIIWDNNYQLIDIRQRSSNRHINYVRCVKESLKWIPLEN